MKTAPMMQQALSRWKEANPAPIDPELISLFQSGFFNNYQLLTEQMFVILDNVTGNYFYISDNLEAIIGYPLNDLYREGLKYMIPHMHPDDMSPFNSITEQILEATRSLPAHEILNCRLSFDYRLRFADNTWHRLLQHNIPLALDNANRVACAVAILTDITFYKPGNTCSFQVVNYSNQKRKVLTEGTIGKAPHSVKITDRERQVIELTSQGLTEKRIAETMGIGIQTVKTYRKNLFDKTGCKNAVELVRYGISHMLI